MFNAECVDKIIKLRILVDDKLGGTLEYLQRQAYTTWLTDGKWYSPKIVLKLFSKIFNHCLRISLKYFSVTHFRGENKPFVKKYYKINFGFFLLFGSFFLH